MGFSQALVAILAYGSVAHAAYDVFDYVDPLIGTANGGNHSLRYNTVPAEQMKLTILKDMSLPVQLFHLVLPRQWQIL